MALGHAIHMVECDTELRNPPLTRGYLWLIESWYSPVFAYLHILNQSAKHPSDEHTDKAWKTMCDNYEAVISGLKHHHTQLKFALKFSQLTLQTWDAREAL